MTVSVRQTKSGRTGASGTGPFTVTLDAPCLAGSKLIAVALRSSGTSGLTFDFDGAGAGTSVSGATGSGNEGRIRCFDCVGGEDAVSITSTDNRILELYLLEVLGLKAGNAAQTASQGNSAGVTSRSTGTASVITTDAGLAVAQVHASADMGGDEGWTNSYTLLTPEATNRSIVGYKILTDGTTVGAQSTGSWAITNPVDASARIAVFEAQPFIPTRKFPRGLTRGRST